MTSGNNKPTGAYARGEWMADQIEKVRLWLARHRILYAERDLHPDPRSRHMFVSDAETAATVGLSDFLEDSDPRKRAIASRVRTVLLPRCGITVQLGRSSSG